jgi:hypothetical protein
MQKFLREKERSSFLKKRSKKLLPVLASAFPDSLSPDEQKFFGSFFQKRTASFLQAASGKITRRHAGSSTGTAA